MALLLGLMTWAADAAPICIASSPIPKGLNGSRATIQILTHEGERTDETCAGPAIPSAQAWKGTFDAVVTIQGRRPVVTNLNRIVGAPEMTLLLQNYVEVNDYNNDGQPDFTVGDHSCGNNSCFHILTIEPSGKVSALPIDGKKDKCVGVMSSSQMSEQGITITPNGFVALTVGAGGSKEVYRWDSHRRSFITVSSNPPEGDE